MAGVSKLVYEQSFISSSSVTIPHNCGCRYVGVKLLVSGESRSDMIESVVPSTVDPKNELTVNLETATSGIIQIFVDDIVELSVDANEAISGSGNTSDAIQELPVTTILPGMSQVIDSIPAGLNKSVKWFIRVEEPATDSVNTSEIIAHYKNNESVHATRSGIIGDKISHGIGIQMNTGNIQFAIVNNEPNDILVYVTRILTP